MTAAEIREALAEMIDGEGSFHLEKAREFSDDRRHDRAAQGLFDLADYVRSLDEGDERLSLVATIASIREESDPWAVIDLGDISSFRFNDSSETFDDAIDDIAWSTRTSLPHLIAETGDEKDQLALLSSPDPIEALTAARLLATWIEEETESIVRRARETGHSWELVARALDRSKQAVWQKYRSGDET